MEKSKVIAIKEELHVKEEITEEMKEEQVEQEREYVELGSKVIKKENDEKFCQNNFNLTPTFSKPPPPTSLSDLPDLPLQIIGENLSNIIKISNLALTNIRMKSLSVPRFRKIQTLTSVDEKAVRMCFSDKRQQSRTKKANYPVKNEPVIEETLSCLLYTSPSPRD